MKNTLPVGLVNTCVKKRIYRSKKDGEVAAVRSCIKFNKPMRVYKCPYCPLWHLTSQLDNAVIQ